MGGLVRDHSFLSGIIMESFMENLIIELVLPGKIFDVFISLREK